MTRDLGNGFTSEGHLEKVEVADVVPMTQALRLDLKAAGDLKILFGLDPTSGVKTN